MGRSAAEAQQFHNSRMQSSIQSSRLPESRFGQAANTNKEYDEAANNNEEYPEEAANNNEEYPDNTTTPNTRESDQYRKARQQSLQKNRRKQGNTTSLDAQIKQKQQQIRKLKHELRHHQLMRASQFMPTSITVFATIPEVLTGGTLGLVATSIATGSRWMWYSKQSIQDKIAIRKQMIITSAIGMIPVVGVVLQGDLVSSLILTPRYNKQETKRLSRDIAVQEKALSKLQSKKRTSLLNR